MTVAARAEDYAEVDLTVIERARRGDRDAYEAMAHEIAQRLYPVAFRILRDRDLAAEAIQRSLVAIWKELPKLRETQKFESWSYRVLLRFCGDELRQRQRMARDVAELTPRGHLPDGQVELANRDQLERAFGRLSSDHRTVLVLTYFSGLTGAEAAAALGIAPDAVELRLHHALRAMRSAVDANSRPVTPSVRP